MSFVFLLFSRECTSWGGEGRGLGCWKEFSFGRDDETTALFFSSFLGWRRRRSFEKKVPDIHAIISRTKDAPPPAPRPGNCVFPRHHRPPTTPRRSRANNYPFFSIPAHPSGPLRARPRHAPSSALRTGGPTQTLLTPPPYVHMIWLPILTSLGLFLFASTLHPVMSASPLVGYDSDRVVADPKSSVAGAHFPVVCVSIMTSVYCHDYGRMGWALLGSMLLAFDLGYVLRTQQRILAESGGVGGGGGIAARCPSEDVFEDAFADAMACRGGGEDDDDAGGGRRRRGRASALLEHASLRFPFALSGGYALAMIAQYLSAFLINVEMHTSVYLVVANVSLVGLCAAGFGLLWRGRYYGACGSLMWYLVSVFFVG